MTCRSPDPQPYGAPPPSPRTPPPRILVDADACPVRQEIYKVAWRRNVPVILVSNARFRIPDHPLITRVVVSDSFDAADDWIAEQADKRNVLITADILLADRCLKAGAVVIGYNGKPFTGASIGGGQKPVLFSWKRRHGADFGPARGMRREPCRCIVTDE